MHDVHGQILEKKNVPRRSGFDKSSAVRWQQLCKTWNHQTAKGKSWANEEFPKRGTYTIKMVVIFGNLNHTAFSKNNGYPIKKIKTVTLLEVGPIRVTSPNSHAGCTNRTPFKFRSPEYIFRKKKKQIAQKHAVEKKDSPSQGPHASWFRPTFHPWCDQLPPGLIGSFRFLLCADINIDIFCTTGLDISMSKRNGSHTLILFTYMFLLYHVIDTNQRTNSIPNILKWAWSQVVMVYGFMLFKLFLPSTYVLVVFACKPVVQHILKLVHF